VPKGIRRRGEKGKILGSTDISNMTPCCVGDCVGDVSDTC